MSRIHHPRSVVLLSLISLASVAAHAADEAPAGDKPADAAPPYTLTGHIDLVSRYYLRGLTTTYGSTRPYLGPKAADAPESDKPALQWGTDFVHSSGFYVGYFGSQINYSYDALGKSYKDRSITKFQNQKSIENDLYGGYTGTVGDIGYTIGATYYYYIHGTASNAFETKLGLSYGPFVFTAQTLLKDTNWGNKGDTYWDLIFTQPLPYSLTFTTNLGFYSYDKEGKYLGTRDTSGLTTCNPGEIFNVSFCSAGKTISGGFRHLIFGISQPIPSTPLTWGLQGIIAGKNRFDVNQGDRVLVTLSAGF